MKKHVYILFAVLILTIQLGVTQASAEPDDCFKYHCWCISTQWAGQDGYGGPNGNIGINIRKIDPRVTRIIVTNLYTGDIFYSGVPFVGQFISVGARVRMKAFAENVGLSCGVHYWIIDKNGNPRR